MMNSIMAPLSILIHCGTLDPLWDRVILCAACERAGTVMGCGRVIELVVPVKDGPYCMETEVMY